MSPTTIANDCVDFIIKFTARTDVSQGLYIYAYSKPTSKMIKLIKKMINKFRSCKN